ncbi:MAG TPA: hypothetical protein VE871_16545 [Longimicrobium sp.]|nr:hypothetical protein [Longimicrobium sp.]
MTRTRLLLLIPLFAAGCATAGHSTAALEPADGDVRFERVSSRAVVVQVQQPVQAAFLYLRPGSTVVASWVKPGVQALPAGSHRVAVQRSLSARLASATRAQGGGRSRPRIQAAGVAQGGPEGRLLLVDRARSARTDGPAAPSVERGFVAVTSAQALDAALLEEVLAEFNEDYAGVALDAGALSRALSERLAAELPGTRGAFTRLPN